MYYLLNLLFCAFQSCHICKRHFMLRIVFVKHLCFRFPYIKHPTRTTTAHHLAIHEHEKSDEQQQWQYRKYYHIKIVLTFGITHLAVKHFIGFHLIEQFRKLINRWHNSLHSNHFLATCFDACYILSAFRIDFCYSFLFVNVNCQFIHASIAQSILQSRVCHIARCSFRIPN